jgi:hypothetical protein
LANSPARLLVGGTSGEALVLADPGAGLAPVAQGSFGAGSILRVRSRGRTILTLSGGSIRVHRGFSGAAWGASTFGLTFDSDAQFGTGTSFSILATTVMGLVGY